MEKTCKNCIHCYYVKGNKKNLYCGKHKDTYIVPKSDNRLLKYKPINPEGTCDKWEA